MKQDQHKIKKGIMVLVVLFLTVTVISAKENLFNKKNNDEGSRLEKVLMQKLKTLPTFASYFQSVRNPSLTGLLKSQRVAPKIDSMVSTAYDTSFQKVKNTYQYDANGFISNFVSTYFDDDSLVAGYSYNLDIRPDGQPTSLLSMESYNGIWTNKEKTTYTYDPSGNQIFYFVQRWDTTLTSWVNKYKYEYTYDANHNMLTDVSASWNSSSGAWSNNTKYEYTYDANHNMLTKVQVNWNSSSSVWQNNLKYEYTYDANNNKLSKVNSYWDSGSSIWKTSSKYEFTYDGNNNLISKNEYGWNSRSGTWRNYYWTLYTYTNNRLTFQNEKKWDSGTSSWVDKSRTNSTYNPNGKYLSVLNEIYDGSVWQKDSEYLFEYDSNDHIVSYIEKDNWNGSEWDRNDKYNFRYNSTELCNGGNHETWFSGHWVSADAMMFQPKVIDNYYYGDTEISYLDELTWWFSYIPGYEYSIYYNGITDVKEKVTTPSKYTLDQNYPNPFNPSTKISYSLPNASHVSLKVYDILGNEITTLVNENQSAGKYKINFDAGNLTSGIYFYQISTGNFSQVRKMMLLK